MYTLAECDDKPINAAQKGNEHLNITANKAFPEKVKKNIAQIEAELATQKALNKFVKKKQAKKQPTAASAEATLSHIVENNDLYSKEAAFIELATTLAPMLLCGRSSNSCDNVVNAAVDLVNRRS